MINNNKHTRKHISITKKIKRLIAPKKGIYAHGRYPKEYFRPVWFNEQDFTGIALIAKIKGTSKKQAAHFIFEQGFKKIMGQLVKEELDLMDTPEGQAKQAERIRFNLELRRLARQRGWNINKLL